MANGWPTPYPDTAIQAGWLKAPQGYQSPFVASNDPRQANINSRARLNSVGIQAPYEPPKTALFWRVLDLLEHPRYAVVGAVKGLTQPGEQGLAGSLKNALSNAWGGLTGKQEHSVSDIMKSYGVKNKLALALGGFAGNVLLDPTTYISPFKALNKIGVKAATAPGLAADVQKVTGVAHDVITKDIVTDISKQAVAGADDAVKAAVQTGKTASTLYGKMAGALGLQAQGDAGIARQIADTLGAVPVRGPRISGADLFNKIVDPASTAAEQTTLLAKIQGMTPKARAYAEALSDQFGNAVKAVDYVDGATRFTKSAGKNWLKQVGPAAKLADEAAEKVTRITLANGIAHNFAEESGRTWLTFLGKPLVETTVVSKSLGKVGEAAYRAAPKPARDTVDLLRRMFKGTGWKYSWDITDVAFPGAVDAATGLKSVLPGATQQALTGLSQQTMKASQGLELAKSMIDDVRRLGGACPQNTALAALDILGPRVFQDSRLSEALVHYMDNLSVSMDPNLLKADGGAAARAWAKAQATLTPGEQALIKKVSERVTDTMGSVYYLEKSLLGLDYPQRAFYMPRAYIFSGVEDDMLRRVAPVIGSTPQKQVASALSTRNVHALERVIPSVAWALEHPDEMAKAGIKVLPDARMGLASRLTDNWRLGYNALLNDSLADLASTGLTSLAEKPGWVDYAYTLAGKESRVWLHPEIANMVQNMKNTFTTDIGLASFMDYTDEITRHIKVLQTTLNPSFHVRNLLGEGIMNFTAGVSVDAHNKALQIMQGFMDRANTITVGGQVYEARDIMRLFTAQGLGFSSTRSRTVEQIRDFVGDMTTSTLSANPAKMGKTVSDFTDTYFRMAHFVEGLERGLTPAGAAEWVRKFHVDYGDLTMFERNVMRRFFPYYTFTRKNIPMQLGAFIENPGIFSGIANLVQSATRAIGNPTTSKFLESNLAIPIYDDGQGHVMYLNWNLPMADLNRFQTSYSDTMREFAGMLHPLLRAPIELMLNKSITTGQTIREPGESQWAVGEYLLDQLGTPGMLRKDIAGPKQATTPGLQTPRQIPGLRSILPVKSKAQMSAAREYELKEILNEITQRAKRQGIYVPTTSELRKLTWGR